MITAISMRSVAQCTCTHLLLYINIHMIVAEIANPKQIRSAQKKWYCILPWLWLQFDNNKHKTTILQNRNACMHAIFVQFMQRNYATSSAASSIQRYGICKLLPCTVHRSWVAWHFLNISVASTHNKCCNSFIFRYWCPLSQLKRYTYREIVGEKERQINSTSIQNVVVKIYFL